MGASRVWTVALCGLFLASACGGDGGSGPSQGDLVGIWQVTKCEYVSTQGLGSMDLILGGGTGTLELTVDDSVKLTVTPVSGPPVSFVGTYEIHGSDLMRVTPAGVTWYWAFDMSFSGRSLSLTNGSAEYDFNGDGTPDPAKWNLYMSR
jgi:hypothetical protein